MESSRNDYYYVYVDVNKRRTSGSGSSCFKVANNERKNKMETPKLQLDVFPINDDLVPEAVHPAIIANRLYSADFPGPSNARMESLAACAKFNRATYGIRCKASLSTPFLEIQRDMKRANKMSTATSKMPLTVAHVIVLYPCASWESSRRSSNTLTGLIRSLFHSLASSALDHP